MRYRTQIVAVVIAALGSVASGRACYAQSFKDAIILAIENSDTLKAEELRLNALKENEYQAQNLIRPNVNLSLEQGINGIGQNYTSYGKEYNSWSGAQPTNLTLSVSQNIYTGNRRQSEIRVAQLKYVQQKAKIRSLKLSIVQNTIEAYTQVVHDYSLLNIREEGVKNFDEQLKATLVMQKGGLVGLTEVSQARTRLASARKLRELSWAKFAASWANLERIIGQTPSGLTQKDLDIKLPETLEAAVEMAQSHNQDLRYFRINEDISEYNGKAVLSDYNPKISVNLSKSETLGYSESIKKYDDTSLNLRITVPLWSGGQLESKKRQTNLEKQAYRYDARNQEKTLSENIKSLWYNANAADESTQYSKEAIDAAEAALKGSKIEQKSGLRTVIEVLNQEQELLDAKISSIDSQNELIIYKSRLITSIGLDPTNTISDDLEDNINLLIPHLKSEHINLPHFFEKPIVKLGDYLDENINNVAKPFINK